MCPQLFYPPPSLKEKNRFLRIQEWSKAYDFDTKAFPQCQGVFSSVDDFNLLRIYLEERIFKNQVFTLFVFRKISHQYIYSYVSVSEHSESF